MIGTPSSENFISFSGQVALVSGAGSVAEGWSNGRAMSVLLARYGATVACLDYQIDRAEETVRIIENDGGRAAAFRADVTSSADVASVVEQIFATYGQIDVLINNVGGSEIGDAVTLEEDVWDRQLDMNLKSAFLMCKHVLPHMIKQSRGSIINISSVAGLRGAGDAIGYAASKAGLNHFTAQIAVRHARDGIRCNAVVPGVMHTPMVEARIFKQRAGDDLDAYVRQRHDSVPIGRMGSAWDVANAVAFLASDAASYITGAVLPVDGGICVKSFRDAVV